MQKTVFSIIVSLILPISLWATEQQTIDIDIEGMSCQFCAHSVQKKLSTLPYIEKAQVNIDTKKAHLIVATGKVVNIEELKNKIVASGFKPLKVTIGLLK